MKQVRLAIFLMLSLSDLSGDWITPLHGDQAQVGESKSLALQNYYIITFHLLQHCKELSDIVCKPKQRLLA